MAKLNKYWGLLQLSSCGNSCRSSGSTGFEEKTAR